MSKKAISHLSKDQRLKTVIETTKLMPLPNDKAVYNSLLQSIVSQQLSVKAASTIHGRFLGLFKNLEPEPNQIIKMDIESLRSVGLSRQKASYIQNVADFFIQENLMEKDWSTDSDSDIIKHLTQIKGVGKWTVQMILMFTLQRPDIFPVDDLGIQNAMVRLYELDKSFAREKTGRKAFQEKLYELSDNWRPYRTIACRYLWQSLNQ